MELEQIKKVLVTPTCSRAGIFSVSEHDDYFTARSRKEFTYQRELWHEMADEILKSFPNATFVQNGTVRKSDGSFDHLYVDFEIK